MSFSSMTMQGHHGKPSPLPHANSCALGVALDVVLSLVLLVAVAAAVVEVAVVVLAVGEVVESSDDMVRQVAVE
jgi:hypothetical protein